MIIRYTGSKSKKTVNIAGVDYVFDPTCQFNEVFDRAQIDWLMHSERSGLFVIELVADTTSSKEHPELTPKPEPSKEKKKEKTSKPKKKRKSKK